MSKRPVKPSRGSESGNFIAEWFGRRVWNSVDRKLSSSNGHQSKECPFLTAAKGTQQICIKTAGRANPTGVCTISSDANGSRQDWLACPYRTLDQHFTLIGEAIRLLYSIPQTDDILVLSGEQIRTPSGQQQLRECRGQLRTFIFLADKLGGEVDLPETDASPGSKVDVSIIEVIDSDPEGKPASFGRHLYFEIQTADFHGSPLHAVGALEALSDQHVQSADFYNALEADIETCGIGVEGPNKSNVFKRTFYQAVLKIKLAEGDDCGGFVLIIPSAVWESWLKHLGNPVLPTIDEQHRTALSRDQRELAHLVKSSKSWIFVFDIDRASIESPSPLVIRKKVAVSTDSLLHYAFDEVAEKATEKGVIARYRETLKLRIGAAWNPPRKGPRRRLPKLR